MNYISESITSKSDIDKKIEIEATHLMYFEYKKKDEAFKEATAYIEKKYNNIIIELRNKGLY